MAHMLTFLWAVMNNWAGYATGGMIMAVIFLGQTLSNKWAPSKRLLKVCCVIFFALAIFKSWDDQYTSARSKQELLEHKSPRLAGFLHRLLITDEPGVFANHEHSR
jgi:predicted membrane protein